ncbi:serine protease [Tahibacter caeni]|uniref:serine protease n=1 Tax=Tahibacter caeni TaxID=1453545 RepID=UPI0021486926|nr:serine protease [Tahibacter caeni]
MSASRLLAVLLLAAATVVHAQQPTAQDYCEADPLARRVADATAMIVPRTELTEDSVNGGYTLTTTPNTFTLGQTSALPLCSDDPYYNQPRVARGRTGFLVGEQTIVTAPHAVTPPDPATAPTFHPQNYAVIFGWRWELAAPRPGTSPDLDCTLVPDVQHIPAANVYFFDPAGPVPLYNTFNVNDLSLSDYMVYSLDRPVTGITPLPLRRSGDPLQGDPLIAPGHPDMLPIKIGRGGRVQRYGALGLGIGELPYRAGVTGSPVFNLRAEVVETVVAKGNGAIPFVYDTAQQCYRVVPELERNGQRANGQNNGPMAPLLPHVPRPPNELVVTPLNLVTHKGTDAAISNAVSSFEVSLSASAAAPVDYRVSATTGLVAPNGLETKPIGLDVAAGLYTAHPGGKARRFDVTATNRGVSCEVIDAEIRVAPLTPGAFASVIPHRFEVVRGDFDVTPDTGWDVVAMRAPYPTHTVILRNPSSVPVTLELQPSASWLRVNGAANATVTLNPAGNVGDSTAATLSIITNPDSSVPPGTTAMAKLAITPTAPQCMDRSADEVAVSFTNGVQVITAVNTAGGSIPHSPDGISYGSAMAFDLDASALNGILVADVDLSVSFVRTFGPTGGVLAETADEYLKIVLSPPNPPPSGIRNYLLWDGNDAPSDYITPVNVDETALTLDAPSAPPLGGTAFSAYAGQDMGGIWRLNLYSKRQGDLFPNIVVLRLTR